MYKRKPFKFGDRLNCTSSMIYPLRAQIRFLRFLINQGFTKSNDLIRYFYFDLFHDGPIRIAELDLGKSVVTMIFRNVAALDAMYDTFKDNSYNPEDFATTVKFSGVSKFQTVGLLTITEPLYYSSEFRRNRGGYDLAIHVIDARAHGRIGAIRVSFKTVTVENISRKLWKYVHRRNDIDSRILPKPPNLNRFLKAKMKELDRYRPTSTQRRT